MPDLTPTDGMREEAQRYRDWKAECPHAPKPAIEPKGQGPVKPSFPPPRIIKESGPF